MVSNKVGIHSWLVWSSPHSHPHLIRTPKATSKHNFGEVKNSSSPLPPGGCGHPPRSQLPSDGAGVLQGELRRCGLDIRAGCLLHGAGWKEAAAFRFRAEGRGGPRWGSHASSWPPLWAAVDIPGKQTRKYSWHGVGGWDAAWAQAESPFSKADDSCGPGLRVRAVLASPPEGPVAVGVPPVPEAPTLSQGAS